MDSSLFHHVMFFFSYHHVSLQVSQIDIAYKCVHTTGMPKDWALSWLGTHASSAPASAQPDVLS